VGGERSAKTDGGAVEGDDENFGVRIKGLGDVEVVGNKRAEPELAAVGGA